MTVCVPTRNRSAMVKDTIASVLAQTFQDFELIVTDNVSTDDTEATVASFGDSRVRFVRHERNLGMVGNWNRGLELARGEYVAILHDDDTWEPTFLEETVRALDRHPSAGFAVTGVHVTDATGRPISTSIPWPHEGLVKREDVVRDLAVANRIHCPAVIVRSSAYAESGRFRTDVSHAMDWEMWLRLALRHDVAVVPRCLARYRTGHGSATDETHAQVEGRLRLENDAAAVIAHAMEGARGAGNERLLRLLRRARAYHILSAGVYERRLGRSGAAIRRVAQALRADPFYPVAQAGAFGHTLKLIATTPADARK